MSSKRWCKHLWIPPKCVLHQSLAAVFTPSWDIPISIKASTLAQGTRLLSASPFSISNALSGLAQTTKAPRHDRPVPDHLFPQPRSKVLGLVHEVIMLSSATPLSCHPAAATVLLPTFSSCSACSAPLCETWVVGSRAGARKHGQRSCQSRHAGRKAGRARLRILERRRMPRCGLCLAWGAAAHSN